MRLWEITAQGDEDDEYAAHKKGQTDFIKGQPDWEWLKGKNEDAYFRGWEMAKADAHRALPQRLPRVRVPLALRRFVRSTTILGEIRDFLADRMSAADLIDAPAPDDVDAEGVGAALQSVAFDIEPGGVTLWRTMDVPENWTQRLTQAGVSVGCFWSANDAYTMGHHGLESHQVRIRARAPLASIDWIGTLVTRLNNVEQEVRLLPGKPVLVQEAWESLGGAERWRQVLTVPVQHVA